MKKPCDIDTLLDEVVTLPSLPSSVAHIMRLVSDPQCPLSAVAQAISSDPPLAMKTLRLVNAAYYGLRQQVGTIEHAVVLLGIKVIKNLAFTATVFDIMKPLSSGMAMIVTPRSRSGREMKTPGPWARCSEGDPNPRGQSLRPGQGHRRG